MKKMTRMECSKECRRILARNGVDLTYAQYSCVGHEVRLTGWLCNTDTSDWVPGQIEELMRDFRNSLAGFNVVGDFENWTFTSETMTFHGMKTNDKGGGEEKEAERYLLDLDDLDIKVS